MRLSFLSVAGVLSGLLTVAVGAILVIKAPCFLVEYVGYADYSIGPFTPFPILPALIIAVGLFTFASALKGHRHFSLLTSICFSVFITSLTFGFPDEGSFRIRKAGYPLAWLAEFIPPAFGQPAMGVIALPFLIDLAFWTLIIGAIIFGVRRLSSDFSGRRRMERR